MIDPIASSLVIERTYAAKPEELWQLWTTKDGFESWWGPQEFRADVHATMPRATASRCADKADVRPFHFRP